MNRNIPANKRHFTDQYDHVNSRHRSEMMSDPNYRGGSGREFNGSGKKLSHHNSSNLDNIKNIQVMVENGCRSLKAEYDRPERSSALDDSFDDTSSVADFTARLVSLGRCQVCESDATKKCPQCSTTYCSEKCAAADWRRHKQHCQGNVNKSSHKNGSYHKENLNQIASGSKQYNYHVDDKSNERGSLNEGYNNNSYYNKDRPSPNTDDRRHRRSQTDDESKERRPLNEGCNNNKVRPSPNTDDRRHRRSQTDDGSKEMRPLSKGYNNTENFSSESQLSTGSCEGHSTSSSNVLSPLMPLSTAVYTQVLVTWVEESGCIWVSKVSDSDRAFTMHSNLQNFCTSGKAEKVDRVVPGLFYAALYSETNEWCRAEVIAVKPKLKIRYIDFGNEDIISINNLRVLPHNLSTVNPMAFKIMLSADSLSEKNNIEFSSKLSIMPIEMDGNTWVVDLEPTSKDQSVEVEVKKPSTKEINQPNVSPLPQNSLSQVENSSMIADMDSSSKSISSKKELFEACMSESEPQLPPINPSKDGYPLPQDTFTEVLISHASYKFVYWVQDFRKLKEISSFLSSVHATVIKEAQIDPLHLKVGCHCAALFEQIWYRAEVLSIDELIEVRFVDYGNKKTCLPHELRKLPDKWTKPRPYAFKVILAPGTPDKYCGLDNDDRLSIKLVSKVGDSWLAQVANVTYGSPDVPLTPATNAIDDSDSKQLDVLTPVYTLNSVIPVNCFTEVEITYPVNTSVYWVKKKADVQKSNDLVREINELCQVASANDVPEFSPGYLCAALFQDLWFRAEVVSIKPAIKVKFIDYGNEEICSRSDIRALPQTINEIPPFAFKIQLMPGTPDKFYGLSESDMISIKPISLVKGTWSVQVESEPEGPTIKLVKRPNIPIPEDIFTSVIISYASEPNVYWVYKKSDLTQLGKILSELKSYCNSARSTTVSTPVVGSCISALFEDDWYRGKIITTTPLKVKFLDYGNDEICCTGSLKDIPPRLSSVPPLAFKVKLADGTSKKHLGLLEGSFLSICPVSQDDDCLIVRVQKDTSNEILENGTQSIPTENLTPVDIGNTSPASESTRTANMHAGEQVKKTSSLSETPVVKPTPDMNKSIEQEPPIPMNTYSTEADNTWLVTVAEKERSENGSCEKLALAKEKSENGSCEKLALAKENSENGSCEKLALAKEKSENGSCEKLALAKEKKISFRQHIKKEEGSNLKEQLSSPPLKHAPSVISAETKNTFLSLYEFTEVLVVLQNSAGDYWVILKSAVSSLDDMSNKLGCLEKEKAIPIVGKTYVHFYHDTWCRAKVVSLNPLTVFFIDYGNKDTLKESEIHPLPSEFAYTPPYAFRIKMAEGTSEQFLDAKDYSMLKIKPVSRDSEGVYTVQVEGDEPPTSSPVITKNIKDEAPQILYEFDDMLDAAVQESSCDLIVNRVQGSKIFSCSIVLPGRGDHMKYISNQIKKLTLSSNFREKVGNMVALKDHKGELGRGVLLFAGDADAAARVAMLDYGYITEPCQLCPLPKPLQDIPPAGVTCKFKDQQDYTSVGTMLKCFNLRYKGNNVFGEVQGRGACMLSPYHPSQELPVLPTVSVKPGTMVSISAVTETSNSIYIHPLTEENAERLQSVILQTNAYCNHGKGLTEEPKRGDIVGCLFIDDGRYYRAQVINIKLKRYQVIFLDFGNTSEVDLKDLQPLSESLKVMPTCAVQVSLAGVDNVALYPEVKTFLEKYIDDSSLTFTMNFGSLTSVVLERKGSCLNDLIQEILKAYQPVKRLMPESIKYVDWTTGKELDLIILDALPGNIFMVLNAKDALKHIIESKLTETLSDYAGTFPADYTYKPSINELVLARFSEDKQWYRAECREERNGSFKVFFLDYGNYDLVSGDHLRPMSVEHLQIPVAIRKCKIYGIPDVVRPEVQVKLDELFSINSSHKAFILDETADSIATIFCPQLKNKVDNNLISLPAFSLPNIA